MAPHEFDLVCIGVIDIHRKKVLIVFDDVNIIVECANPKSEADGHLQLKLRNRPLRVPQSYASSIHDARVSRMGWCPQHGDW